MTIPTEPIGSVPRSEELVAAMQATAAGSISQADLDALFDEAVRDTIARMEATGSPVVTDGEQRKPSFVTYPVDGLASLARRRRRDSVRGRAHPAAPGDHRGAVPVPDPCRCLPAGRPARGDAARQAGRHLRVRPQPALSGRRDRRLLARGLPRRSRGRGRGGHPRLARRRRLLRPDRFHGGPSCAQARPFRAACCGASSS